MYEPIDSWNPVRYTPGAAVVAPHLVGDCDADERIISWLKHLGR